MQIEIAIHNNRINRLVKDCTGVYKEAGGGEGLSLGSLYQGSWAPYNCCWNLVGAETADVRVTPVLNEVCACRCIDALLREPIVVAVE